MDLVGHAQPHPILGVGQRGLWTVEINQHHDDITLAEALAIVGELAVG